MSRSGWWVGLIVVTLVAAGCMFNRVPVVVRHTPAALVLDNQVFENAGCPKDGHNLRHCADGSPVKALGCDGLQEPDNLLGGLTPRYPMVICTVSDRTRSTRSPEFVYNRGCILPSLVRYVVYREGHFQLLKSSADLQAAFAPVETPQEALSYALASTGMTALYGVDAPAGYRYFVDKIEETHVESTPGGYLVHLYQRQVCGCGPHTVSAVAVRVAREGVVEQGSKHRVYENPKEDGLCVD